MTPARPPARRLWVCIGIGLAPTGSSAHEPQPGQQYCAGIGFLYRSQALNSRRTGYYVGNCEISLCMITIDNDTQVSRSISGIVRMAYSLSAQVSSLMACLNAPGNRRWIPLVASLSNRQRNPSHQNVETPFDILRANGTMESAFS